jgi:lipid-binding SYLF domain-containing protein
MKPEAKSRRVLTTAIFGLLLIVAGSTVMAQDDDTGDWRDVEREAKRLRRDEIADTSLQNLFGTSIKSETLFEKAYGWAAFRSTQLAFGLTGGGGNGVAIDKQTGERFYMKMATGGIGFGIGGQTYDLIFFFQDKGSFYNFVENGWQANAGARASAGTQGANAQTTFTNGVAVYQVTKTGLMANVDLSGTKFWKNKKLNN